MKNIRKDFPLLDKIIYLDTGAGALKPKQVVDAISEFYLEFPINPHSIDSKLGSLVASKVKETRELIAKLIDAAPEEVVLTSGTTESLNMFADSAEDFIKKGDEILVSKYNHISNIMPWKKIAEKKSAKIIYSENIIRDINSKTKIVSYAQENNTIAQHINIDKLYKEVKKNGAILVNDAAQAIAHTTVSLHESDVIVFSSNKIYGPTGIGGLIVRQELLSLLKPKKLGGGIVTKFDKESYEFKKTPYNFEAGTPNTAGIIGLGAAIKYFNSLEGLEEHETNLAEYAFDKLTELDNINLYSKKGDFNIMFNVENAHSQDVVSYLGQQNIILRSGEHCAKLLKDFCPFNSTIRLSIGAYNTKSDIDKTINAIKQGGDFVDVI